jgi:hypothetical protein
MMARASSLPAASMPRLGTIRACPRWHASIGIPWILVFLHALALIASSMFGLAMAFFLI